MSNQIPTPIVVDKRNFNTPEHRLWIAVLKSFLREVKQAKGSPDARKLLTLAQGNWYQFICDLIDVPHELLVEEVERLLGYRV